MAEAALTPTARLLRRLVRIPSVSPDDDPGTTRTGEAKLAVFLKGWLERIGGQVRLHEIEPGRPNLLSRFPIPSSRRKARVLFLPHLDTVSVAGMSVPPFAADIRRNRIYGRGATDTKGPMAAMLMALKNHLRDHPQSRIEWHFGASMGEESGCRGARILAQKKHDYDLVIVAEPTDCKIVHAHKGCLWLSLSVRGKAGHISTTSHADNAIHSLAPLLHHLNGGLDSWLESFRHPELGTPTCQATVIRAGTKANICPAKATVTIDLRTVPGMTSKVVRQHLSSLPGFDSGKMKLSVLTEAPPLWTDPDLPLLRRIEPATVGLTTAPWFCDASCFGAVGTPAIALGPGSIHQAHTKDEFISLPALEKGYRCYRNIMQTLEA